MADQTVTVSNLETDSKYRVAFDLMKQIDYQISDDQQNKQKRQTREYWLTLYAQCRSVVVDGIPGADAAKRT